MNELELRRTDRSENIPSAKLARIQRLCFAEQGTLS
jgi:hypothetical protein